MSDAPAAVRLVPASPTDLVVVVCGLRREFPGLTALEGVDLRVGRGEIHALLGPNGAGKTTLLRTLSGLVTPTAGSVQVLGAEAGHATRAAQGRVGLVPSGDRTFYLRLSGVENLVFFARLQGLRRREARTRAREVLAAVDLLAAGDRRVATYSHGMQKRLSIARALLTDPPLLLVDEATHDLDPEGARRVRELIADRARGGTAVLWASQRLEEIRSFADGVTLLTAGRVRFCGTVAALLSTGRVVERAADAGSELEAAFLSLTTGAA